GQDTRAGGGIAEVVNNLMRSISTADDRCEILFVPTSGKKGLRSQYLFVMALLKLGCILLTKNISGAHLHLASRGSTYRKLILSSFLTFFRVPYLLQLHSGDYQQFFSKMPVWQRRCVATMFKRAAVVTVLSRSTLQWVEREFPEVNGLIVSTGVIGSGSGVRLAVRPMDVIFIGRLVET